MNTGQSEAIRTRIMAALRTVETNTYFMEPTDSDALADELLADIKRVLSA